MELEHRIELFMALIESHGKTVEPIWAEQRSSAYSPFSTLITDWKFKNRPVILFSYQRGSALTRAELYGVDNRGTAAALGSIDGALVQVFVLDGRTQISVADSADLHSSLKCYEWQEARRKLLPTRCAR